MNSRSVGSKMCFGCSNLNKFKLLAFTDIDVFASWITSEVQNMIKSCIGKCAEQSWSTFTAFAFVFFVLDCKCSVLQSVVWNICQKYKLFIYFLNWWSWNHRVWFPVSWQNGRIPCDADIERLTLSEGYINGTHHVSNSHYEFILNSLLMRI